MAQKMWKVRNMTPSERQNSSIWAPKETMPNFLIHLSCSGSVWPTSNRAVLNSTAETFPGQQELQSLFQGQRSFLGQSWSSFDPHWTETSGAVVQRVTTDQTWRLSSAWKVRGRMLGMERKQPAEDLTQDHCRRRSHLKTGGAEPPDPARAGKAGTEPAEG